VLQELGFIGLAIFLALIISTYRNCAQAVRNSALDATSYLHRCSLGARDFYVLLLVFSIASYGLNEYQWYMLAGLSVVLHRLTTERFDPPVPSAAAESRFANILRRGRPVLRARTL
jgi:O-antigen ligase